MKKTIIIILLFFVNIIFAKQLICPKCHRKFPDTYSFCIYDGSPLKTVNLKHLDIKYKHNKPIKQKNADIKNVFVKDRIIADIKKLTYKDLLKKVNYFWKKDKKFTLYLLKRCYLINPKNVALLKLTADFYMSIKDYDNAVKWYDIALKTMETKYEDK